MSFCRMPIVLKQRLQSWIKDKHFPINDYSTQYYGSMTCDGYRAILDELLKEVGY